VSDVTGRVLGALKAAYNFISGDPIVLAGVAVTFVLAAALEAVLPASARQLVSGAVFVALILLSLALTLERERAASARRTPRRP
jgi:hypothetical protein